MCPCHILDTCRAQCPSGSIHVTFTTPAHEALVRALLLLVRASRPSLLLKKREWSIVGLPGMVVSAIAFVAGAIMYWALTVRSTSVTNQ